MTLLSYQNRQREVQPPFNMGAARWVLALTLFVSLVASPLGTSVGWQSIPSAFADGECAGFADVASSDPACTAIATLIANGTITGYATTPPRFGPDDPVQRAQMATFLVRALHWQGMPTGPKSFTDFGSLMGEMRTASLILANKCDTGGTCVASGYGDGRFGPSDPVTRAQVITFITRAFQLDATYDWEPQPGGTLPYNGVPSIHQNDVRTYHHYVGTIPAAPADEAGWNQPAPRAWVARVLFQALDLPPSPSAKPTPSPSPVTSPSPSASASASPSSSPAPVAGQPCPAWVHDAYVTQGPDGKMYPTWHPPVDPTSGCRFGHEHGADPRTSKADSTLPAFGYAAALLGMTEPHTGYKVFVINAGTVSEGTAAKGDYRIVFHMGTAGVGRYTQQFHSLEYDYVAQDGTGRFAHAYGMGDTGTQLGSTCDPQRKGNRDFSTVGCDDPYEIWTFSFSIKHPSDPYTDPMHVRTFLSGSVAVFDPITTRDPADNARLLYSVDYYYPGGGIAPDSTNSPFLGCARESYGGPNYWNNAGRPTVYYTDPYGNVKAGPGPGLIKQETSALNSTANGLFKYRQDFCGGGIHAPN